MKNLFKNSGWLAAGVLALGLAANAQTTQTFFDNTTSTSPNQIFPGATQPGYTSEYGNQVFFPGNMSAVFITSFSFEYYAIGGGAGGTSFSAGAKPTVEVRWYLNNGPLTISGYQTPLTSVFDSGPVPLTPTAGVGTPSATGAPWTLTFSGSDFGAAHQQIVNLANSTGGGLTWTVQFGGMGTGDNLGVVLAGSPTVAGSSVANDYWLNSATGWTLQTDLSDPIPSNDNIAQTWMGTAVPEPSTLALSLVGGFGLLMAVRRFRK
jgi:hypothetical protein